MVANRSEEDRLHSMGHNSVVGCDESGCGCFSGAVFAAAVIFPHDIDYQTLMPGLNDSKKKSEAQRDILYDQIKKHALSYAVASASVAEIDEINIYWAKFLAMRRAIEKLEVQPDYIIVDGDKLIPEITIPQHAIVKGDSKSISIAAASILAKVDRDRHICELADHVHEDYGWKQNKSYYCKQLIDALKKHGKTPYCREKYVRKFLEK